MLLIRTIFGLTTLVISNHVIRASPTDLLRHRSNGDSSREVVVSEAGPSLRFKRQESTLQQTLQNLQNTQQQQSQTQRRPGQQGGFNQNGGQGFGTNNQGFGTNNQGFGNGQDFGGGLTSQGTNNQGFGNGQGLGGGFGVTGSGQDTGFTNGFDSSSSFNQGFPTNGQNQGNQGGGFNNGGNFGTGGGFNNNNQGGGGLGTTVRNPLNVATDENTIPQAPCMRRCQPILQFNPVCGSDNITYTNEQRFRCAQQCGRQVQLAYYGTCVATQAPSTK